MAQKSSKFGEIITKTVAVEENEPNQTSSKRLPPPPPSQMASISGRFSAWWSKSRQNYAPLQVAILDRNF